MLFLYGNKSRVCIPGSCRPLPSSPRASSLQIVLEDSNEDVARVYLGETKAAGRIATASIGRSSGADHSESSCLSFVYFLSFPLQIDSQPCFYFFTHQPKPNEQFRTSKIFHVIKKGRVEKSVKRSSYLNDIQFAEG